VGSLAQDLNASATSADDYGSVQPTSSFSWSGKRQEPYRCRNGGELYCCTYVSGRDNPCKSKLMVAIADVMYKEDNANVLRFVRQEICRLPISMPVHSLLPD
jgi:hypothetical protein